MNDPTKPRRRTQRLKVAAAGALVAGLVVSVSPAGADGHLTVVADGLDNPRGIALGPAGRIYVAEAGRGGDILVDAAVGGGDGPVCVGMTGTVTEIFRGRQNTVVTLPSLADPDRAGGCDGEGAGVGATGPHDVDLTGKGQLSVAIGLGGAAEEREKLAASLDAAALFGTAQRILPNGKNKRLTDLAAFEAANDINNDIDSNPYGIALVGGSRPAVDAGANTLVEVTATGTSLVASFAPQCVPWVLPFPNPIPDGFNPCGGAGFFPAQSVPTAVAVGPDGDYYVSELGGFPFAVGTARVWKVDADRAAPARCSTFAPVPNDGCEVYATGLTSVVDLAFGSSGVLYAVQLADAGVLAAQTGGPLDGSVQVIPAGGGTPTAKIGGLVMPGGVAVDRNHLYITNYSTFPGAGQVVRVAAP